MPQAEIYNKLYSRGIVFIHVPKCGGTSVDFALRRAYPFNRLRVNAEGSGKAAHALWPDGEPTIRDGLGAASEIRTNVLKYALGCGYSCITGHAPLATGMIEGFSASHDFITILRDPVSRFKSHYRYSHNTGRHGDIVEPIDAFLDTPRARDLGRLFIKYYGLVDIYKPFDEMAAIESSKQTLNQMSAVGFVDRMDNFSARVAQLSGSRIRIGHVNRGAGDSTGADPFSPEVVERIKALCAPDIEIYNWARREFADGA